METAPTPPQKRKPRVKIAGQVQDLKKTEVMKKPLQSAFLLTINTNQQYKSDDPNLQNDIQVFENTIQDLLQHVDEYVKLPDGVVWNDDTINDVDIQYTIERGGKKGCLHIHVFFKFKHFTKVQLNYEKIKAKICGDLGLPNIFMENRLIRNAGSFSVENYLNKYV